MYISCETYLVFLLDISLGVFIPKLVLDREGRSGFALEEISGFGKIDKAVYCTVLINEDGQSCLNIQKGRNQAIYKKTQENKAEVEIQEVLYKST